MTARRKKAPSPTRRQVLRGLAAAIGAGALAGGGAPGCKSRIGEDALPDVAADLGEVARHYFGSDLRAARLVGEAYLGTFSDTDAARADLEQTFAPLGDMGSAEELARDLEISLDADFEDAAVFTLEGWPLGLTELRTAAAAHLTA